MSAGATENERADKYRREAIAVMAMIEQTRSREIREQLLKLATNWLELAEEVARNKAP